MSQKIPNGYQLLRAKGIDLFTFSRDDRYVASEAFSDKRRAIDAMWQDFRARATAGAAAVGMLILTGCATMPPACGDGYSAQVCEASSDRAVL